MTTEFKLPYYVENLGDGSVRVVFTQSKEEAVNADAEMCEGWGEPSSDTVTLKVEDDALYFQGFDSNYNKIWIEVKQ